MRSEPYISSYLHSKGRLLGLPIAGNFEITQKCNFNCPMCYVHSENSREGRELSAQEWLNIAEQARSEGMIFALITGGESFVRKDFFDIYDGMKEMGLLISINSNGSLIKDEVLERLRENPPFRMNISLYGGSNETYKKMCGSPMFDRVIENIRNLKSAGIDVRLNCSITQYNCADIEKIYETSKELGVHLKATSYMYPPARLAGAERKRLSACEAAECSVLYDAIRFTENEFRQRAINMRNGIVSAHDEECEVEKGEKMTCRAGRSSFWLTWDGKMLACGMMPEPVAYPLNTGFKAAWDKIKKETEKIVLPMECAVCSNRGICCVCAAVCQTETGGFEKKPEYVCKMTEEIYKLTQEEYRRRLNEDK